MANEMVNESIKTLQNKSFSTETLALPDVIVKTGVCLAVVVAAAVPGWLFLAGNFMLYLGALIVAMITGFIMARRAPVSPLLALGYSVILGLIVGAFSSAAVSYGGNIALIPQAVIGTIAGTVGMLVVYATPFGKRASKATKLFFGVMLGYFAIGILSLLSAVFFSTGDGWGFYGVGTLGLLLCAFGVVLACWSLLMDFGRIDQALNVGAPRSYDWTFGVSLASSIVWVYIELLRILSIISGR